MATELATAYISLVPSARGIKGKIERELAGAGTSGAAATESAFSRAASRSGGAFKSALKGAAVVAGGVLAGVGVGAKVVTDAASDYAESVSKIHAVFGGQGDAITKWADGAAKGFGQSKQQALEAAGTFGNLLTSFGLGDDASAGMSKSLVELASDLASFNNTKPEEALEALRSGLTGEMEPLKRYGVALDDASLKAKALALGIADGKSVLTPAQKAQASYALILERTKNAQGDFARTSGGLANQQRIFAARVEDLKVKVGQALLPALAKLLPVLGRLFDRIWPLVDSALPAFQRGVAAIGEWWSANGPAITAAVQRFMDGFLAGVQVVAGAVQRHWPEIQRIISTVVTTVRTVIEGVVTTVSTLWANFGDNILSFVQRVWPRVQQIISGAMEVIRGVIQTVTSLIRGDWSGVWEGIKNVVSGVWEGIQGIIGAALEQMRLAVSVGLEVLGGVFSGAWEGIKSTASGAFDAVVGFVTGLPGRLLSAVGAVASALGNVGRSIVTAIFDGIKDQGSFAVGFARDIANALIGFVNKQIIDRFNDLVEVSVSVPVIGKVSIDPPDVPHIPRFHGGGVVPGRPGTERLIMAMAGERVVTERQDRRRAVRAGSGPSVIVRTAADAQSVARIVRHELGAA